MSTSALHVGAENATTDEHMKFETDGRPLPLPTSGCYVKCCAGELTPKLDCVTNTPAQGEAWEPLCATCGPTPWQVLTLLVRRQACPRRAARPVRPRARDAQHAAWRRCTARRTSARAPRRRPACDPACRPRTPARRPRGTAPRRLGASCVGADWPLSAVRPHLYLYLLQPRLLHACLLSRAEAPIPRDLVCCSPLVPQAVVRSVARKPPAARPLA